MMLFNPLTKSAPQARAVTQLVLAEHLATDVFVEEAIVSHRLQPDGQVSTEPMCRVLFQTKALLYRRIEQLLQEQFPANDFRIHATPVT